MKAHLPVILFSTAFVWAVFGVLWAGYDRPVIGIDDANIYQVYMRNLAQGHGLVYQVGGERVEGFTSLLWVLLGSMYYKILPVPEWGLIITSVFIVNYLVILLNIHLSKLFGQTGLAYYHVFFCLLLFAVPGYFDWTLLPQLETSLWSLLLTVCALQVATRPTGRTFGAGLALLILTRPESMVWAPLFGALRVWRYRLAGDSWAVAFRRNALPAGLALLVFILLTGWRLWYFGYPLPNTFYAKVSSAPVDNAREGLRYVAGFIRHHYPVLLLMYGWSLAWLYRRWRARRLQPGEAPVLILIVLTLVQPVFPLLTGGDHFYLGRMLQPLLPLTGLVFTYLFFTGQTWPVRLMTATQNRLWLAPVFLAAAALLPDQFRFYQYGAVHTPLWEEYRLAEEGRRAGLQLDAFFENTGPLPVIGVICAGGIAYTYTGPTLDLLGLNNLVMAHAHAVKPTDRPKNHGSFDPAVFYRQRPDLVYPIEFVTDTTGLQPFDRRPDFDRHFMARALEHVHREAAFKELYVPAVLSQKRPAESLYAYFRRTYIAQLDTNRFHIRYLSP